jgi:outer membrane murein-binding lipoprotein Lpp
MRRIQKTSMTFPPPRKSAQIVGQIFIYVLAIIVMAAILLFGYRSIANFKEQASQVSTIQLQNELSSAIDSLSSDFGSVKKKSINLDDYSTICLVESYEEPSLGGLKIDPLIRDSIESGTEENVFLLKSTVEASFAVDKISVEPDVLCLTSRLSTVELRLEGRGDHVDVSGWQE